MRRWAWLEEATAVFEIRICEIETDWEGYRYSYQPNLMGYNGKQLFRV